MTSTETIQGYFSANPLQAILFDLDGTLVDSVPDIAFAADAALDELGFDKAGETQVRSWVGNGARQLMQRALAFATDRAESAIGDDELDHAYRCFLNHYASSNGKNSRVYPTVIESLRRWQQHWPLAVVTNKPIQFVPQLLADLGLDGFFSLLVGGECAAEKKPSPLPLYLACEKLGVAPENTLMVGDSSNDVLAAKAAGMPVIAVNYGYNHGQPIEQTNPNSVVGSFSEIQLEGLLR